MSSTRSSESAFRSSWKEASIVTCSGSQPSRSTTMFLKSSKLSFWVSNLASSATAHRGCLEDLDELALELAPGRRDFAHRGLEGTSMRAAERAFDHHRVALGDDLLVLDPRVREGLEPGLVVFLRGLYTLHLDAAWRGELDVRRGVSRHRLEVVGAERLGTERFGRGFVLIDGDGDGLPAVAVHQEHP